MHLNDILQVQPTTWTATTYTGRNCVTVELEIGTSEYNDVAQLLREQGIHNSISKIERIQHPFAYGRFLLRKEQLEERNGYSSSTDKRYYEVSSSQVKEAIEFNMDTRRTSSIRSCNLCSLLDNNKCVIITQHLSVTKSRDSEEFPEYVIYFD